MPGKELRPGEPGPGGSPFLYQENSRASRFRGEKPAGKRRGGLRKCWRHSKSAPRLSKGGAAAGWTGNGKSGIQVAMRSGRPEEFWGPRLQRRSFIQPSGGLKAKRRPEFRGGQKIPPISSCTMALFRPRSKLPGKQSLYRIGLNFGKVTSGVTSSKTISTGISHLRSSFLHSTMLLITMGPSSTFTWMTL